MGREEADRTGSISPGSKLPKWIPLPETIRYLFTVTNQALFSTNKNVKKLTPGLSSKCTCYYLGGLSL